MKYIDTHCHLAMDRFDHDREDVVAACLAAGVEMLCVGGDPATSRKSVELAGRHAGVRAAVGAHPCDADRLTEDAWRELAALAKRPETAAIGETGLDYHWKNVPAETQKRWFARHIGLSLELGKPLVVHARDSVGDVLAALEPFFREGLKAVWHCFTAGKKEIGPALDFAAANGLYLGIGGLVTFEDQKTLREHARRIPDELLLLETDSPFIIPRPRAGDRNDPRGVIRVAEVLAELRATTPDAIASLTTNNAKRLIGA